MPITSRRKNTSGPLDRNWLHPGAVGFGLQIPGVVSRGERHMATVGERAGLATTGGQGGTEPEGSRDRGRKQSGMEVPRVFSAEGVSPFDQVDWDFRTAEIKDERGRAIFQPVDCEFPRAWSQLATNGVVSK